MNRNLPSLRHRAVDVPRLRDSLVQSWTQSTTLDATLAAHRGTTRLPVKYRDEARQRHMLWTLGEWCDWLRDLVAAAELFYVTPDMTELVMQAAAAAPEYQVHADQLPAERGFVVFGKPYCAVAAEALNPGQRVELQAALWGPVPDTGDGPGVMLVTLQDADVLLSTQPLPDGDPVLRRRLMAECDTLRRFTGPLAYHEEYAMPFGANPWGTDGTQRVGNAALAAVMTTWILMGQRITVTERAELPRSVRKAAARAGHPDPLVRTVSLRQAARGRADADEQRQRAGEPSRRYTKRWPVRGYGYWRNTWYPSRERHEQQWVWVPGYMKGPEGAPLVGGERVNVLRR